jgi:hypothetical protein
MARKAKARSAIGEKVKVVLRTQTEAKTYLPKRLREGARWEEAMRLGSVGLVSAFVFRVFWDAYYHGVSPDFNYALYHGIIFGVVVTLVWKFWPWQRD